MKKSTYAIFVMLIVSGIAIYFSKIYWLPYYNYYFTKYDYSYPTEKDFVVGTEPHGYSIESFAPFVKNILKIAFPKHNIVFDDNRKPDLIIRSETMDPELALTPQYLKWNVPYITISSERWTLKRNRYRKNGPPIAELVSATPKYSRQLYFPWMMWCGLKPERVFTDTKRSKFLAYIAYNCTKKRDKMFTLIKSKDDGAEALGVCSNPQHKRLSGSWGDLDQVYAKYNFGFAMENHQVPGYITEKIIAVFRGGAIPIYWGDNKTVDKYFNPKAFINVGKFASFEDAANYIVKISKDPEKVAKMQREPILKDNILPEFFKINETPTKEITDAANFIKKEYFKFIKNGRSRAF